VSQEIRVAVVGTGDWGANLVRNFASLPGVKVAALCDSDAERLRRMSAKHPQARAVSRIEDVAADPEIAAAVVAASAVNHYPLAKALLQAGKDVFVEKPLALNAADAEELVQLAKRHQRILMVGHLLLYHPAVRYLKDLVLRGELGDLYYVTSQRVNLGKIRRDENALWSFAPHDLSVILHLLGAEPLDVAARGSAFLQSGVDDVVFLHLRFAGGRMAHVHVSWLDPHKLRQFTVVGSLKMAVFDDMEASEKIRIYDKGVDRVGEIVSYSEALSVRSGDIVIPRIDLKEPLRIECQHFVDCVRDRKTPLTDGASGLSVVRVLRAAQASLEAGGAPVPVTPQTAGTR